MFILERMGMVQNRTKCKIRGISEWVGKNKVVVEKVEYGQTTKPEGYLERLFVLKDGYATKQNQMQNKWNFWMSREM